MKVVKWSRIVIRNFPTQRWTAPTDEEMADNNNIGAEFFGSFVKTTQDEMTQAIRQSHPLLTNAIFMEGPDWTCRGGPPEEATQANVSFTVPDPDESMFRQLTRNPLIFFSIPCHLTQWTEKVALVRCDWCWKYGDKSHPDCPIRCGLCGGGHSKETHTRDCKRCIASNIDHEERKKGNTTCPHPPSCPNCMGSHHAADMSGPTSSLITW